MSTESQRPHVDNELPDPPKPDHGLPGTPGDRPDRPGVHPDNELPATGTTPETPDQELPAVQPVPPVDTPDPAEPQ